MGWKNEGDLSEEAGEEVETENAVYAKGCRFIVHLDWYRREWLAGEDGADYREVFGEGAVAR